MSRIIYSAALLTGLLSLSACMPEMDMQGVDPRDYYAAHPIKNKVVSSSESHVILFESGASKPSHGEVNKFREEIFDKSLLSAQAIEIQLTPADMRSKDRKAALEKMLKYMGYRGPAPRYASSDLVVRDQALVTITFATVVPPNCPDWRLSPSNNFSNSSAANMGCATEVNLGQMVADPRDLQRGTGELPPTLSERGDVAMKQYRTGGAAAASAPGASSSPGEAPTSADAAAVAPTPSPQ